MFTILLVKLIYFKHPFFSMFRFGLFAVILWLGLVLAKARIVCYLMRDLFHSMWTDIILARQ